MTSSICVELLSNTTRGRSSSIWRAGNSIDCSQSRRSGVWKWLFLTPAHGSQPFRYSHSGADTPCTASPNISGIAHPNWPIGTISPPCLLVEYRSIYEDEVLRGELPHLLLPSPSQLITTSQRDPKLILCPFPPLQHSRDCAPMH